MENFNKRILSFKHEIHLFKKHSPKSLDELEHMSRILYASAIGNIMYATLYTRLDISYIVGLVS